MKNSWIIYFIINFTAVLFSLTIGPDIIEEPKTDAVSTAEFEALMAQAAAMFGELPEPAPVTTEDPCEDPEILWDNKLHPNIEPPYANRGLFGISLQFHGPSHILLFTKPPYTTMDYHVYGPADWFSIDHAQIAKFYPPLFTGRDVGDYVKFHPRPVHFGSWRDHMIWLQSLRSAGYQKER